MQAAQIGARPGQPSGCSGKRAQPELPQVVAGGGQGPAGRVPVLAQVTCQGGQEGAIDPPGIDHGRMQQNRSGRRQGGMPDRRRRCRQHPDPGRPGAGLGPLAQAGPQRRTDRCDRRVVGQQALGQIAGRRQQHPAGSAVAARPGAAAVGPPPVFHRLAVDRPQQGIQVQTLAMAAAGAVVVQWSVEIDPIAVRPLDQGTNHRLRPQRLIQHQDGDPAGQPVDPLEQVGGLRGDQGRAGLAIAGERLAQVERPVTAVLTLTALGGHLQYQPGDPGRHLDLQSAVDRRVIGLEPAELLPPFRQHWPGRATIGTGRPRLEPEAHSLQVLAAFVQQDEADPYPSAGPGQHLGPLQACPAARDHLGQPTQQGASPGRFDLGHHAPGQGRPVWPSAAAVQARLPGPGQGLEQPALLTLQAPGIVRAVGRGTRRRLAQQGQQRTLAGRDRAAAGQHRQGRPPLRRGYQPAQGVQTGQTGRVPIERTA